jgi:hypothetical protein
VLCTVLFVCLFWHPLQCICLLKQTLQCIHLVHLHPFSASASIQCICIHFSASASTSVHCVHFSASVCSSKHFSASIQCICIHFSASASTSMHLRPLQCTCLLKLPRSISAAIFAAIQAAYRSCVVGQNCIYYVYAPYMTVYLVLSLPKIPYIHHIPIYMVLVNPVYV